MLVKIIVLNYALIVTNTRFVQPLQCNRFIVFVIITCFGSTTAGIRSLTVTIVSILKSVVFQSGTPLLLVCNLVNQKVENIIGLIILGMILFRRESRMWCNQCTPKVSNLNWLFKLSLKNQYKFYILCTFEEESMFIFTLWRIELTCSVALYSACPKYTKRRVQLPHT